MGGLPTPEPPMPISEDILSTFRALLEEARQAGDPEPTAMTLATADAAGRVSARTVLLKDVDAGGFAFYTNTLSRKGRQLGERPQAALLFLWKTLRRQVQVKVEGRVEPVGAAEADAYFASRPRDSQIGAWASIQSEPLDSRETLLARVAEYGARFEGGPVPRPPHWSGYRVVPDLIEFWYGGEHRLHDRFQHRLEDGAWVERRLYP
jgi:pyridoxamine 5'-phosphate oxidase